MDKIPALSKVINNSPAVQRVLKGVNKNPAVYNAAAAFTLASIMRPTLIGCFNFKDEKDKRYSQASSVAAGVIELFSTVALFIPINKSIDKASEKLYNSAKTMFTKNPAALRKFKSLTNRGIKILTLIPISFARFSLVKPIVNLFFPKKTNPWKVLDTFQKHDKDIFNFQKYVAKQIGKRL